MLVFVLHLAKNKQTEPKQDFNQTLLCFREQKGPACHAKPSSTLTWFDSHPPLHLHVISASYARNAGSVRLKPLARLMHNSLPSQIVRSGLDIYSRHFTVGSADPSWRLRSLVLLFLYCCFVLYPFALPLILNGKKQQQGKQRKKNSAFRHSHITLISRRSARSRNMARYVCFVVTILKQMNKRLTIRCSQFKI